MSEIRIVERTGSTNADLIADEQAREGDWLVALTQDAGRGRQGRAWQSEAGNFAGSTLVALRPDDPPTTTLSLAAGIALFDAVAEAAPKRRLALKWPNDLLLDGDKLAGILLERSGDRVVAGFGVNLACGPQFGNRTTASLGGVSSPRDFAPSLARQFARRLAQWRAQPFEDLRDDWLGRAHSLGTQLTVHASADDKVSGLFAGIDRDGALRLDTAAGMQVIRAGDVDLG